ncbi:MAG TPA: terminase large subunit [Candidatus Ventricola gallistercoris]|nr:terminase large subunit [Candidatus Ventricola gallistercoris]
MAFDERKAQRVVRFIEALRHTKGEFHGQPFHLLPWQEKIIRDVFGTVRDDNPTMRQYTTAYIEIPKKNGKSELGAAIALNMLINDDEWKAEVYSCASDRQQAAIVFDVAVDMVRQSPALMKRVKIIPSTRRMIYQPTGSIYQVLSSEVATKHGLNVSACIFDELHTQPTRALYDVMTQGSGDARRQPLWFFLTTAGTDRNSICWEVHQKALDILEGRKIDPRFYPVLFGLPDDADWTNEENWYRANPSLDHTITIDKVRDAFRKAQETPADENQFRQLRLNQWVKQSVRWMPMDKWDECGGVGDPYALEGRACYAGLDLSSTSDLTALVLVFPPTSEDEPYIALPFFWLPEETLSLRVRRDHVPYDQWAKRGFIQTTEGNVVHYGFIERFICELGERYNIREIAHDRWNATMMVQTLEDDGFTMVPFGQGFKDMSPPTKELMRIVLEHKLCHGGHPVLRWNMDNAYVRTDPAGNLKLDKEKSTEKIDGVVALVMALDRAQRNLNGGSVYDERGLLTLDW